MRRRCYSRGELVVDDGEFVGQVPGATGETFLKREANAGGLA